MCMFFNISDTGADPWKADAESFGPFYRVNRIMLPLTYRTAEHSLFWFPLNNENADQDSCLNHFGPPGLGENFLNSWLNCSVEWQLSLRWMTNMVPSVLFPKDWYSLDVLGYFSGTNTSLFKLESYQWLSHSINQYVEVSCDNSYHFHLLTNYGFRKPSVISKTVFAGAWGIRLLSL